MWDDEKSTYRHGFPDWVLKQHFHTLLTLPSLEFLRNDVLYISPSFLYTRCIYRQMYFVLTQCTCLQRFSQSGFFGSPGVHLPPGLTSSITSSVCVHVYIRIHPPIIKTPTKIEKHTRQTPYQYTFQNIAPHASTKCQPWTSWKRLRFQLPLYAGFKKHLWYIRMS